MDVSARGSVPPCRAAFGVLGRSFFGSLKDEGMIGIAVGHAEGDFSVEHVPQQFAANFGPPTLQDPRRLPFASRLVPAHQVPQVGGRADERFGDVQGRALIHERDSQQLADDVLIGVGFQAGRAGRRRQFVFRDRQGPFHSCEDLLGRAAQIASIHVARGKQVIDRFGLPARQFENQVVPKNPPRGPVPMSGLGFAPQRQLADDRHLAGRQLVQFGKPVPRLAHVFGRDLVNHSPELGVRPVQSSKPRQRGPLLLPNRQHVFHVFQGVLDLGLG